MHFQVKVQNSVVTSTAVRCYHRLLQLTRTQYILNNTRLQFDTSSIPYCSPLKSSTFPNISLKSKYLRKRLANKLSMNDISNRSVRNRQNFEARKVYFGDKRDQLSITCNLLWLISSPRSYKINYFWPQGPHSTNEKFARSFLCAACSAGLFHISLASQGFYRQSCTSRRQKN